MEKSTIFWMLMILWFIFGIVPPFLPDSPHSKWIVGGGSILLFVLLALIGSEPSVFGKPVK